MTRRRMWRELTTKPLRRTSVFSWINCAVWLVGGLLMRDASSVLLRVVAVLWIMAAGFFATLPLVMVATLGVVADLVSAAPDTRSQPPPKKRDWDAVEALLQKYPTLLDSAWKSVTAVLTLLGLLVALAVKFL